MFRIGRMGKILIILCIHVPSPDLSPHLLSMMTVPSHSGGGEAA